MNDSQEIYEYLESQLDDVRLEFKKGEAGKPWISVDVSSVFEVMKFLRDNSELLFDTLMCLSGVHYPQEELGVSYHLHSTKLKHTLALKARVPIDDPHIPSVESIWKTANWHEREAWDMVGIIFDGHPNHRRILCPEDWEGHALRKDYVQQEFYQGIPTTD